MTTVHVHPNYSNDTLTVILRRPGDTGYTQYAYLDTDPHGDQAPTLTRWVATTDAATPTNDAHPGVAFRTDDAHKIAHAILDHLGDDGRTTDVQRDLDRLHQDMADAIDRHQAMERDLAEARATITGLERTLEAREAHLADVRSLIAPRVLTLPDVDPETAKAAMRDGGRLWETPKGPTVSRADVGMATPRDADVIQGAMREAMRATPAQPRRDDDYPTKD